MCLDVQWNCPKFFDCLRHLIIGSFAAGNDKITTHIHNILQNIITMLKLHFRGDPTQEQLAFGRGTLQGGKVIRGLPLAYQKLGILVRFGITRGIVIMLET